MEDCIRSLNGEIKCRDSLIGDFYSLLCDLPLFQSIFVYGHVSCGKSLIVTKVLEYVRYNMSVINCLEHTTNRSMFEKILIDLRCFELSSENGYKLENKCDNLVDFISQIKQVAVENSKPIVILFERSERLRDMDANIMQAFLRLKELTQVEVCTIFTTDVVWHKFISKTGEQQPLRIHFPQYTKDEIQEILLHSTKPHSYDEDFYSNYLNLFLSVYYRFCRDLRELKYMSEKNFIKYVEPIESGLIKMNDTRALWKNICSTFKTNLEVLYLRMSAEDFDEQAKLSRDMESTAKLALSFELPFYAKFLLIAAYLASYNPQSEDRRLFMKQGVPNKKRSYKRKKTPKTMTTRDGPRSFQLRRMLAIFCNIIEEKIDINAILLTQIPTMVQLGLLSVVDDSNIDEPKYKCCVGFDFVMVISKNVGFELKRYLFDYAH